MILFENKNNLITNIWAFWGYIATAVVAYYLLSQSTYYIYFWLPIGFSIFFTLYKGFRVLVGLSIATIISHFTLISLTQSLGPLSPTLLMAIALSVVEIAAVTIVFYAINRKKYSFYQNITYLSNHRITAIAIVIPLLLSITQFLLLFVFLQINISFSLFLPLLFGNALIFFLSISFSKAFHNLKNSIEQKTNGLHIIFALGSLSVITTAVLLPQIIDSYHIQAIAFTIIVITFFYAAIYLPFIAYSTFILLSISELIFLFSNYNLLLFDQINHSELFAATLLIAYFAQNVRNRIGKNINDEDKRQVKEYSKLNDRLLTEIEKLGNTQKEIKQKQEILTDAQAISGIATWEYIISSKKFNWITYDTNDPLFDFNIDKLSINNIRSIIHPDDLKQIINLNKLKSIENADFEFELRILSHNRGYNYYWIKGKAFNSDNRTGKVLGMIMDITNRKESEQILLEREQRHQALFDSNIDPISVVDAHSAIIHDVNPAFERVYEYNRDEIIGKSYMTLSDKPSETESTIETGRNKGHFRVIERLHIKKSGKKFHIESNVTKHILDGKEMLFIITHDITRRKESGEKIAEREQKFRTFFESDLIGMAEVSFTKEFISFNNQLTKILGYSQHELLGKNLDELTHPDDIPAETKLFNLVITHKSEGYSIEKRFIARNSVPVHCKVSLKGIKNALGAISHFIILVEDISVEKRTELELKISRAKLSQAQAVAKLGSIWFYPGIDTVTFTTEAYKILEFGEKRPVITRRDFFRSLVPNPNSNFEKNIYDLENGIPVKGDFEQAFITPNGDVKYILSNFGITKDDKDNVKEVLVTLADITRIKEAEMAWQEANTLKDQLFSIISHDLRSPISSISQLIELYADQKDGMDKETRESTLNTLQTTSKETYALLENLLEWANSQRTDIYKPKRTNLAPLFDQVIALSLGAANAKGISIQKDIEENIPVFVDEEMIKTALRNLVSNSIKFTPNSGTVNISSNSKGDSIEISIADSGVGIPENKIPILFDNNFNFTSLGTNKEKGTGLGLKLVKNFIDKNGGKIHVESIEGQGSTFTISFPKYIED
ncbi:MAG: PAS domain S-box protein [Bacteroidales bacterium]|nr:PAS domain S-box protein [Bacteroidales bacterium]